MAAEKNCPDCQRALTEIRVIDKAHYGAHTGMDYSAADAIRSFWSGFPVEGQIDGFMCDKCGRVLLYARPKD